MFIGWWSKSEIIVFLVLLLIAKTFPQINFIPIAIVMAMVWIADLAVAEVRRQAKQ